MFSLRRSLRPISTALAGAAFALVLATATPSFAAGVAPSQATPVQREQAQSRFLRGRESLAKGQTEAALAEFSASLEIVASPNTRLYVGRCLRDLGRIVAAYVELGRTEVEAKELSLEDPRYEKAGQSAHEERALLEPKLGFVIIEVAHGEPNTTLKVAGDEIRPGGWSEPLPVMPGTTEVIVETPGRAPVKRTLQVAANERQSVAIDAAEGGSLQPPAAPVAQEPGATSPRNTTRTMAYVAGGVAVVGLGMFTYFGLKSNGTYSDLESACNKGPCPPGEKDRIDDGRTQQTLANIGLAVFVVGAAAGVTLWVLGTPKSAPSATSARLHVGPGSLLLGGSF